MIAERGSGGDAWPAETAARGVHRLRRIVRRRARRTLRWCWRAALDARDRLSGRRDPMVPPRRLGMPSQLHGVGARIVEHGLIDAGGLRPDDRVLDIGCGVGRVAAPLTRYLDGGSYEGFDVMPKAIHWAQTQITPRHPQFRFQLADLRNDEYSPEASGDPGEYRFPYDDDSFDVALAVSLYTHMFPFQLANYLRETARVLHPGGRSVATFFLLNPASEELLARGVAMPVLAGTGPLELSGDIDDGHGGRFRARNPDRPEAWIALHESDVRELYERAGLRITEIRPGDWCGRRKRPDHLGQDLIVAMA